MATFLESQVIEMTDTVPAGLRVREVPCAISVFQTAVCYFLLFLGELGVF